MPELFIVPKQMPTPGELTEQVGPEGFELTGDAAADLETALHAAAFLFDWLMSTGPDGLRECASVVRAWRVGEEVRQ